MDSFAPIICMNEHALQSKLVVFVRDMVIQKKRVRLIREGNRVICENPRRVWVVASPTYK